MDTARARIRIANSRSNRASTASIIYSNGTKVIYFNRYVQRTVRINEYNWPDTQFFKNYYYILKVRSGESDGAPASRSGIHSGANDGTLCGRRSVCPFNPFLMLSLLSYVRVHSNCESRPRVFPKCQRGQKAGWQRSRQLRSNSTFTRKKRPNFPGLRP